VSCCLLLAALAASLALLLRLTPLATRRLARALARRPEGAEVLRAHWFGQCYAWRLGTDSLELLAWAGPGVWLATASGLVVSLGSLALLMGAPAAAAVAPRQAWLQDLADLARYLLVHPCAWTCVALAVVWTALTWRLALAHTRLLLEAHGPLRWERRGAFGDEAWEVPPGQVLRLEQDDNWILLVLASPGEGPAREERRMVLVAGRGDRARLTADVAELDEALRARLAARRQAPPPG
jgi:hypothetical protein